jgi:hypothetical protein
MRPVDLPFAATFVQRLHCRVFAEVSEWRNMASEVGGLGPLHGQVGKVILP